MPGCCIGSNAASKAVRSFWLLGLLNNSPWVLMLAVATNISAGGVALVFLANQIPGLLVKVSAPYWFHRVSYRTRMLVTAVTMGTACFLVGCGGLYRDEMAEAEAENNDQTPKDVDGQSWGLALELFGVSFVSFSCSLGEASLLALAGKFDSEILPKLSSSNSSSYLELSEEQITIGEGGDHANNDALQLDSSDGLFTEEYDVDANHNGASSEENESKLMKKGDAVHQRRSITAFSSGTGMAGVAGYAYKAFFSDLLGWSFSATVWSAIILSVFYYTIYMKGLYTIEQDASTQSGSEDSDSAQQTSESSLLVTSKNEDNNNSKGTNSALEMVHTDIIHNQEMQQFESPIETDASVSSPHDLTSCERFTLVLSLWRYTIPLFTVYAAEYMLQAGVWSAIGFPVTSASARAQFYHYSNWVVSGNIDYTQVKLDIIRDTSNGSYSCCSSSTKPVYFCQDHRVTCAQLA